MKGIQADHQNTVPSQNIFGQPLTIFGVPVDRGTIFANHKGVYKNRIEKRQRKLIVKTTFIKFYLHHEEHIRCLTNGYSPISALEQLLTGPAFLYFKRAIFIFTDKRILHIPSRFNRSSRSAISQIMYEDCARVQIKGRSLIVHYKNGQQEIFPYLGRKEKKKIRALIDELALSPKEAGRLQGRVYMCPSCTHVLAQGASLCDHCKLEFKSGFQAKLRSLLIPGGGYFYSRYPFLGICVATLEILLVGYLVVQAIHYSQGMPLRFGLLAIIASVLVCEKVIASFHSRQLVAHFVPEPKDFAMRKI